MCGLLGYRLTCAGPAGYLSLHRKAGLTVALFHWPFQLENHRDGSAGVRARFVSFKEYADGRDCQRDIRASVHLILCAQFCSQPWNITITHDVFCKSTVVSETVSQTQLKISPIPRLNSILNDDSPYKTV